MNDFKQAKDIVNRNSIKKGKQEFVDDQRSLTDMNVPGFSWYLPKRYSKERQQINDLKITRKERLAMIIGALQVILPMALMILLLFFGAFLVIMLWLM